MKAILGEYGKIIILSIVLCGVLPFLFQSTDNKGFAGLLSKAKPTATVGRADTFELAEAIFSRKPPELTVTVQKLQRGREYDLLDAGLFQVMGSNEAGEPLPVSVERITDPMLKNITNEAAPAKFKPELSGPYVVLYRTEENFEGSIKTTEKEYRFIVD